MKVIKRYIMTVEEELSESFAEELCKQVNERKGHDSKFGTLRYHEQLEEVYRKYFKQQELTDGKSELVDWSIEPGQEAIKPTVVLSAALLRTDRGIVAVCRDLSSKNPVYELPSGVVGPGEDPEAVVKQAVSYNFNASITVGEELDVVGYEGPTLNTILHCFDVRIEGPADLVSCDAYDDIKFISTLSEFQTLNWAPTDKIIVDKMVDMMTR